MAGGEAHVMRRRNLILQLLRDTDELLTCQQITDAMPATEDTRWGEQAISYGNIYANLRQLHAAGRVNRTKLTSGTYWGAAVSTAELATFNAMVADYGKELSE